MNQKILEEYLNNLIKPALEQYAKEHNTTVEEILLQTTTLENTGLFNYKGRQSTVYNRLTDCNIRTLKELFEAYDNNTINYGKNELKNNHNYYIHNEIDGIISLLKYKYLRIIPENLTKLLNYKINFNFEIYISPYSSHGYPGDVTKNIKTNLKNQPYFEIINSFYKTLKSCGFDQSATKALIDIAYEEKTNNITLGEFLLSLSLETIKERFKKIPAELTPFLNILNIINDFQKEYNLTTTKSHKR